MRGSLCSRNGIAYERQVHSVLRNCFVGGVRLNTQNETQLGGSSNRNDIECNHRKLVTFGIEIKKLTTPDWMQCSLHYDDVNDVWQASKRGFIPERCRFIFNKVLKDRKLFHSKIPPFIEKDITHIEWIEFKKTGYWKDCYVDIGSETIRNLYREKGCYYIQISNKGVYHLGEDICNWNVPMFDISQEMRIRIKVHTRSNAKGFCKLSVTASCKPKKIKQLQASPYSLDCSKRLPLGVQTYGRNDGRSRTIV
jgi:hypothetical protein